MSVFDFTDAERMTAARQALRAARERGERVLHAPREGGDPRVAFLGTLPNGHEPAVTPTSVTCAGCGRPWNDKLLTVACAPAGGKAAA